MFASRCPTLPATLPQLVPLAIQAVPRHKRENTCRTNDIVEAFYTQMKYSTCFFTLTYSKSEEMVADLFTKAFTDVSKFVFLRALAGIAPKWQDTSTLVKGLRSSETEPIAL